MFAFPADRSASQEQFLVQDGIDGLRQQIAVVENGHDNAGAFGFTVRGASIKTCRNLEFVTRVAGAGAHHQVY